MPANLHNLPVYVKDTSTLCRSCDLYTVPVVPAKQPNPKQEAGGEDEDDLRGIRIPLPRDHWWRTSVKEILPRRLARMRRQRAAAGLPLRKRGKYGYEEMFEAVREIETDDDELRGYVEGATFDKVRRCLRGTHVTWEMAAVISHVLGIPRPAMIAASEEQARLFASPELPLLLAQLKMIASTPDSDEDDDQTDLLGSEQDGDEQRE